LRNDRLLVLFLLGVLLILPFTVTADRTSTVGIKVVFPDRTVGFQTDAGTVGETLRDHGVNLEQYERTFPSLNSQVVNGLTIFLYDSASLDKKETVKQSANRSTRTVYTHSLPKDRELLVRGNARNRPVSVKAFERTDARIVYRGGPEYKANQVDELVDQGKMTVLATGYSAHPKSTAPYDDGVSALGIPAGYGLAAVDPDVIPLGTRLYVEGYGYAIAADVGGGINGRHIDLCFDSHRDALEFGRRWVDVYVLG
jgi:3D (Asp-Asp-Asp) domain-containing protein